MNELTEIAKELEHYVTPDWAVEAILKVELLTKNVIDPCTGFGILGKMAEEKMYNVWYNDVHTWGPKLDSFGDYLEMECPFDDEFSVFMNPPFSLATNFVDHSLELGARKVVCFQRFAWWESAGRRDWWEKNPPNRVYVCGNRATCWRADIPDAERKSGSTTAHAWFVWERGQPKGTVMGHIWKEEKENVNG